MSRIILALITTFTTLQAFSATEKILWYQPDKNGIVFQVTSGGCTHKEDFRVEVESDASATLELTLIRLRPDTCYPFIPMGERFYFSYDELGLPPGMRFRVVNPNGIVHAWIWEDPH